MDREELREQVVESSSRVVAPGTYDNYYAFQGDDKDSVLIMSESVGAMAGEGVEEVIVSEKFIHELSDRLKHDDERKG